jgi:hypothetical protein
MISTVFVFSCGSPDLVGLSVRSDGGNIPAVHDGQSDWSLSGMAALSAAGLSPLLDDPRIAISNLHARGYHIARRASPRLPQAHRSVA